MPRAWQSVQDQPGVSSTTNERYDDLLSRVDIRSQSDPLLRPWVTFIEEHREKDETTKALQLLINALKKWVATKLLERQATHKEGPAAVNANTVTTGGCLLHPGSDHTLQQCRRQSSRATAEALTTRHAPIRAGAPQASQDFPLAPQTTEGTLDTNRTARFRTY
jgi:hypothetical protein